MPGDKGLAVSTLGWQVVYRLLAGRPDFAVERFFLGERGADGGGAGGDPVSADGGKVLSSFPLIALSVTYEEDFLHLPPRAVERPDFPLVLVGGPPAFLNPAPIAPFADIFFVGEAEDGLVELCAELKEHYFAGGSKDAFLERVKDRPGVYVPGRTTGRVRRAVPKEPGLAEPGFSCFTSPEATFKDTLLLEVNRGCPYGCRFCAAGFVYRPPRLADIETLKAIVEDTDPPKVGLVGTALTDWPDLLPFLEWLHERKTKFSLSSIRADGLTEELLAFLRKCGVRTITLALEGASERLRRAASKKLDPQDFLDAVERCARHGVNHLRIYCIVGWPGETDADFDELGEFLHLIDDAKRRGQGKRKKHFMRVTVGVSCLVPKPWTPFQFAAMRSEEELDAALKRMRSLVKPFKGMTMSGDNPFQARLQALLARGDERLAEFIELAADLGWAKALKRWDGDPSEYIDRERPRDEALPWDVLDIGVSKQHLWDEWVRSGQARTSPPCPAKGCDFCRACGMDRWLRGESAD